MGIFSSHVAKSVNMQMAKLFMSRLKSRLWQSPFRRNVKRPFGLICNRSRFMWDCLAILPNVVIHETANPCSVFGGICILCSVFIITSVGRPSSECGERERERERERGREGGGMGREREREREREMRTLHKRRHARTLSLSHTHTHARK